MLKQNRVNLELNMDREMSRMMSNAMRGCIFMISGGDAKPNDKYMGTLFDPTKPRTFICNLDSINLL